MKKPKRNKGKRPNEVPEKPGGRALERLHQFEQERGIKATDVKKRKPSKPVKDR